MPAVEKKLFKASINQQYETRLHRLLLDKYNYDPIYSQYIPQNFIDFDFYLKANFALNNRIKGITSK